MDSSDPAIGNSLSGAAKLAKYADIDKYKYSGQVLDLICKELFHFLLVNLVKM